MFAALIVASGVFRGAGDTFVPSCLNLFSMWVVRIPLAAFLAPRMGLWGVWIAMCLELCVRGLVFLIRLAGSLWHVSDHEKFINFSKKTSPPGAWYSFLSVIK